jgi:dCTP deaminase
MNLSDKTILKEIENGNIIISPFNKEHLNPNSVDLTLAPEFKIYTRDEIKVYNIEEIPKYIPKWDIKHFHKEDINEEVEFYTYLQPLDPKKPNSVLDFTIPEHGYVLQPGRVYLYACNERIGVKNDIRAVVMGKSSLGRLGLFIHVTAGFIDTGFEGSLVLELVATQPVVVYPNMKICQIEFTRVEGEIGEDYSQKSGSKYHGQTGVQESKYHENYDRK